MKLFIYLILLTFPVYAVEIILNNGEAYIGELIREDDKVVKFKWKTKIYEIPKKQIREMDKSKTGASASYLFRTIELKAYKYMVEDIHRSLMKQEM